MRQKNDNYEIKYKLISYDNDTKYSITSDFVFEKNYNIEDNGIIFISIKNCQNLQSKTYLIYDFCLGVINEKRVVLNGKYVIVLLRDCILKIDLEENIICKKIELEEFGTYFDLYEVNNKIIISGEVNVYCMDYDLNIINMFNAEDVITEFKLNDDSIELIDFNGKRYKLGLDASFISDNI